MDSREYMENVEKQQGMSNSQKLMESIKSSRDSVNNSTQQSQNSDNNNQENKARLSFDNKLDFEATVEADITRTLKIGYPISNNFALAFKDFTGCIILPGKVEAELVLYFKPGTSNQFCPERKKFTAIGRSTDKYAGADQGLTLDQQRLRSLSVNANPVKTFFLTPQVKSALARFVSRAYVDPRTGNVRWNELYSERSESGYMNGPVIIAIKGISLSAVIAELYGDSYEDTETKERVKMEYSANIITPFNRPGTQLDFLLLIARFDTKNVRRIEHDLGQPGNVGTIPMCRPEYN